MNRADYLKLLKKYEDGLASGQEVQLLHAYYNLFEVRNDGLEQLDETQLDALREEIRAGIQQRAFGMPVKPLINYRVRITVAAAVLAAIAIAAYFLFLPAAPKQTPVYIADVAPGKSRAILTTSDGSQVDLSDSKAGVDAASLRYSDGSVIDSSLNATETISMLSVATPRGGQYQVVLPDGTKVWLNAASKISFPSKFNGKERRVQLDGEAYLEVAASAKKPFIVESRAQTVEVLGTHFNINSYGDERSVQTTLLEGAVRVVSDQKSMILQPGQQAINTGGVLQMKAVDTSLYVDWKNQEFIFRRESLESLMRRVSRWYDIDVVFAKDVDQQQTFSGQVSRTKNISEVLKSLERTGLLKYTIEGTKVTIMNNFGN